MLSTYMDRHLAEFVFNELCIILYLLHIYGRVKCCSEVLLKGFIIKKIRNMKLRKNIATSEEGFVFNPGTGDSFSTNPIGTEIISLLKEDKSLATIIESISSKYEVDKNQFEKDLDDFVLQLKESSILEQ